MAKEVEPYLEIQVLTTSPGGLVVLLYDGALKFLDQAEEALKVPDYERVNGYLARVQDIINELNCSLNLEAGRLAEGLRALYAFINERLVAANVRKDPEPLAEVRPILIELREAWVEASQALAASKSDPSGGGNCRGVDLCG